MRSLIFILTCFVSFASFAQEAEAKEEFLPINLEGKEAFLSTKTGEYVFLEHAKTDATKLETTNNGVIYTDIKTHDVAKKETISKIAKLYSLSKEEVIKQNKLSNSKLSIGQQLKIIKKIVVKSSSPVISQEEATIIAKLSPGQTPTGLDAAPTNRPTVVTSSPVVKETEVTKKAEEIENTEEIIENVKASTKNSLNSFYTVKKGDNLYNIAKRHDISVDVLKKLNNLESNNLSIGQKLKLQ
ncbi:LysM peptidoglycan-binding domain-containing protein [Oceanihabitans sp. 2_MG-2023]|uniref:LysM peptidoglycan-binding domain-containing protein n=1 Tax=Oceanihabitans sp. 2_MG-2023 TaxID=3062661 RepID=UPI0026E21B7C|nr:LysM peptidoglycan-binding domain-containing protein [Oceanihabitans sp. 2_MG-2023]MDO6597544.1 LysM peptidoglycan-binding domain-containing protein [Oceanihabitans sp. 2_MG-2023]